MVAGAKDLRALTSIVRKPMVGKSCSDFEPFDRLHDAGSRSRAGCAVRNIPLPVSEVVNMASLGLIGARAERLVERTICGCDVLNFYARTMSALGNVSTMSLAAISGYSHFPSSFRDFDITLRAEPQEPVFELMFCVWLTKQLRAFDKQGFHFCR